MNIEKYIVKHEAIVLKPYTDTVGKLTIGIGRNLDDRGISEDEALYLLKNDLKIVSEDLLSIFDDFFTYPDNVQLALKDMMFNLGKPRFLGFKKMIAAIKVKDFKTAAKEAKSSHWCSQVGKRCQDNYELLYNS